MSLLPQLHQDIHLSIFFFLFLHSTIIAAGKLVISNIVARGIINESLIDYY